MQNGLGFWSGAEDITVCMDDRATQTFYHLVQQYWTGSKFEHSSNI
jgi:hypothetical protein